MPTKALLEIHKVISHKPEGLRIKAYSSMFLCTYLYLAIAFSVYARLLFSVEKAKKAMLACTTFVPLQKKKSKLQVRQ